MSNCPAFEVAALGGAAEFAGGVVWANENALDARVSRRARAGLMEFIVSPRMRQSSRTAMLPGNEAAGV